MDYQNKLYELLKIEKEQNSDFDLMNKYQDLMNSLEKCFNDTNHLKDNLYFNPYFVKNSNFHKYYNFLQRCAITNNSLIEKDEIANFIKVIYNIVNEEYQTLLKKLSYYDEIDESIRNFRQDILINFITNCFKHKNINREEYINLSKYIMSKELSKKEPEELLNEVVIDENTIDLSKTLSDIFNNFGYDMDSIPVREKKKLLKYAKIDNVKEVLSFLKEYSINPINFQERIKIITDLIIFYDRHSISKIKEFLMHNACSLNTLLGIGTIFFSRDIKFKFRKHLSDGTFEEKEAPKVIPQGNFESFLYNIELIKKDLGYTSDYKITDNDLANRNILLVLPKEVVSKNLTILKRYGIVKDNKLPKALSSLNTKNTEYLLDRYIEAGLYDYLVIKQPNLSPDDNDEFRWFKIKRARQLGDNIFATHGIKQIYINDDEMYGISKTASGIRQVVLNDEKLNQGLNILSLKIQKPVTRLELFNRYFNCRIIYPTYIFKANLNGEAYPTYGSKIESAFLKNYQINDNQIYVVEQDPVIRYLDNLKISSNEEYIPIKKNDYEYYFAFPGKNGNAKTNLIISRQKVLRLCSLLKQEQLWVTDDMPEIMRENIILSVLLKDTIVTTNEIAGIRGFIRSTSYRIGGRHK